MISLAALKGYLLAAVGGLATIGAMLIGARRSGRARERAEHTKEQLEQMEAESEVKDEQLEAAANRPRDRESVRNRLRDGSA